MLRAIIGKQAEAHPQEVMKGRADMGLNAAYPGYDRNMKKTFLFTMVVLLTAAAFAEPYHHHHRRHRHHPHVDVVIR
jgi:hypothetical protein